jgi:hypothetical protein
VQAAGGTAGGFSMREEETCMQRTLRSCLAVWLLTGAGLAWAASEPAVISLAGQWRFSLDPNKEGLQKEFFKHDLSQKISLPGSTDEANAGIPNPAKPSLDGLYRPNVYEGQAWYQRDIDIPAGWQGKRIVLSLERVHWDTRVWVDGTDAGARDTLISPHVYELPAGLAAGRHRLTILVDNTKKIDLGRFVSINYEGTQTNWNGLIGKLELRAKDPVSIEDIEVYPDVARKTAKLSITVANVTGHPVDGKLTLSAALHPAGVKVPAREAPFTASGPRSIVTAELPMGANVRLWDEFSPNLYDLTVSLSAKSASAAFSDSQTVTFGMRDLTTRGTQFIMNGRPLYLRGTLECGIFPRTGYPPTDVAEWRRIYRVLKSYGLNFIRFHSWTPPDAAFAAADVEGVMIQTEGPIANVRVGDNPQRDSFVGQELIRIVHTYGNHPSFCLMTLGNEYGGTDELLSRWVGELIKEDSRHLYSSASSAQVTANRQFTESGRPRGVQGTSTAFDFADIVKQADRPLIGHEIGQWTFYPNFDEEKKYTGVLKASNFELIRDDLAAKHMLDLAPRFVQATGMHAVLLYKEEIEVLMRTPGHTGFSLLDLHDYPGQGTALIGILDPFWDSKGFIAPEKHRQYCGPTVPLLRMPKRTYTTNENFAARVDVAHFGPRDLSNAQPLWRIRNDAGAELASGSLAALNLPTGKLTSAGEFTTPLAKIAAPARLTVTVSLKGTQFANEWQIWVYPPASEVSAPAGAVTTRKWEEAKAALAAGKNVILFPESVIPSQSLPGKFLPVFWSPVWFPNRPPATMGILCDPKHPAFAQFPTDFYSNWQWWDLLQNSRTLILNDTPATFRPIVQVIDNFSRNDKLGNLLEAQVGDGRLLLCTIDLPGLMEKQPAARQLLRSLYAYVGSPSFRPSQKLEASFIDRWFAPVAGR